MQFAAFFLECDGNADIEKSPPIKIRHQGLTARFIPERTGCEHSSFPLLLVLVKYRKHGGSLNCSETAETLLELKA